MCASCSWQEAVGFAEKILERDADNEFADAALDRIEAARHVTPRELEVLESMWEATR